MSTSGSGKTGRGRLVTRLTDVTSRHVDGQRTHVYIDPRSSVPSGPNADRFRSYFCVLAKTHVSILLASWDDVPKVDKNILWQDIQDELVEQQTQGPFVGQGRDDILTTNIRKLEHPGCKSMHEPVIDEDDEMAEAEDDPLAKLMTKLPKLNRGPVEVYWDNRVFGIPTPMCQLYALDGSPDALGFGFCHVAFVREIPHLPLSAKFILLAKGSFVNDEDVVEVSYSLGRSTSGPMFGGWPDVGNSWVRSRQCFTNVPRWEPNVLTRARKRMKNPYVHSCGLENTRRSSYKGLSNVQGGSVLDNRLKPLCDDRGAMHTINLARLNGELHLFVVHLVSELEVIHLLENVPHNIGEVEVENVMPDSGETVGIGQGECEKEDDGQCEQQGDGECEKEGDRQCEQQGNGECEKEGDRQCEQQVTFFLCPLLFMGLPNLSVVLSSS
ncbi:hypothetical protein LR48_Vigan07g193700 [Vigna angularis]|uniref:Uncharacterized protein n=1 Tax=Phaseolus angularis TaxID=3914 RepID=A0A0L9UZM1_PHAAN|nr:hypothetical protein LR48_Vigan07g193700 [Vigna angularis]